MSDQIQEGLNYGEMQGLVNDTISIDQFKPKIGDNADTVVVAFTVQYEKPAQDLSNFIETGEVELLDVEVSPGPDSKGTYKVFIEMERDNELFAKISSILNNINNITSDKGQWKYTAYKLTEPREFDKERFARDVITDPDMYRAKYERTADQEVKERMEFLVKY